MKDFFRAKEQGHVLMITVVIVLVVGLLAGLGFIFWQNFIKQPAVPANTSVSQNSTKVSKTNEACASVEKVCFNYPDGWSISDEVTSIDQTNGDALTIKNADNTAVGFVLSPLSGVGGTCDPQEPGTPQYTYIDSVDTSVKTTVPSYGKTSDYSSYVKVFRGTINIPGSGYYPIVYLSDLTFFNAQGAQPVCFPQAMGTFTPRNGNDGVIDATNYGAGFNQTPTYYQTESEAKAQFDTSDFKTLYSIFQSVHY